ncbi:hypothetical protein [Sutcliffiella sp. NC1]|uniref:hypothetical protein n=1 Tax=Sutcliffiella sp. NC1 TaxID=3004096 RepID=UPI0022DDD61A|nr:hypothetical protein [Sutcliffiella sp. NC1]WBL16343.1 hypothetical protein O1A01_06845 [Sutcliffiella sp. NC1]
MKTVDLVAVQAKQNEVLEFIAECVALNRESVVSAVKNLNGQFTSEFIIATFTDQILAAMLQNKPQDELVKMVANGQIFSARERIIEEFNNDFAIRKGIRNS